MSVDKITTKLKKASDQGIAKQRILSFWTSKALWKSELSTKTGMTLPRRFADSARWTAGECMCFPESRGNGRSYEPRSGRKNP